jgi:putative spermidine/putrescine transport system permease protein
MTTSPVSSPITVKVKATRNRLLSWLIYLTATLYFLIPLVGTFYWSLRGKKAVLGFEAYRKLFADTSFLPAFSESIINAVATIILSLLIVVPTAYWVTFDYPSYGLLSIYHTVPFVIPAVVLVFGIIAFTAAAAALDRHLQQFAGCPRLYIRCLVVSLYVPFG